MKPTVLVTGISGYIGAHVALEALKSDKYQVRGSVRNKDDQAKQRLLQDAFGDQYQNIEVVNADLLDEKSIRNAVKGKPDSLQKKKSVDSKDATMSCMWPRLSKPKGLQTKLSPRPSKGPRPS